MVHLLGLVLVSFLVTSLLLIPFIDLLFFLKHRQKKVAATNQDTDEMPIHKQLLAGKDLDTPVGGGILVIILLVIISLLYSVLSNDPESFINVDRNRLYVLLITVLGFGFIGFLDDFRKIFKQFSGKYKGIQGRYIFALQLVFAVVVSTLIYTTIKLNNFYIPGFEDNLVLGWWYIPIASFVIVSYANAVNISDGLDGLSTGLLLICLFAYLVLAHSVFDITLSMFVGIWIGCLIAYLYFNVFPARVYLGDAGAYGFGATLAVVGLLSGKVIGLGIIGGVFIIIVASSLLQLLSKRFLHRKLFPVAPIHMYFKYIGWEEPKIVMRFWLAGIMFAIFGIWLALLSN